MRNAERNVREEIDLLNVTVARLDSVCYSIANLTLATARQRASTATIAELTEIATVNVRPKGLLSVFFSFTIEMASYAQYRDRWKGSLIRWRG